MSEDKKPEAVLKSATPKSVKVKNTSKKMIHLQSGKIEPGDTGVATPAEASNHYAILEVVK